MDERAARLAEADEEDFAIDLAKNANLRATAIMCRWREDAETSLGKDNDITKHYQAQIDVLREQLALIRKGDKKAIEGTFELGRKIKAKYGKKQKDISIDDHLRLYKPNGPR